MFISSRKLFSKRILSLSSGAALSLTLLTQLGSSAQSVLDLDLSSTQKSVSAKYAGQILLGDNTQVISVNDLITPAERIALYQSNNGGQNLILSANGSAIGGTFNVTDRFSPTGNFVIPAGVTAVQTASSLNLTGNLTNSGTLFAVPQNFNAIINASNIMNNVGAIISTMPPISSGLSGVGPTNLTLNAAMNIVNAGQILSSANLNLTAGGSIVNALPTGVTAASPVMQAMNNITMLTGLSSQIGSIVNSGLINSIAGNINVSSSLVNNILFNNTNGTLLAQLGSINFRDASFTPKLDFDLLGGDVISKSLNIWSGQGTSIIDIGLLTGTLNVSTGVMHLNANTPDLSLGTITILGDPTFFNQGNVQINSAIQTNGNSLAIVASGNVTSTTTGSINTTQAAGAGGNVLILAGAAFTTPGAGSATSSGQNGGAGDISSTLTITGGASSTGGFIDLSNLTTPAVPAGALSGFQTTATGGGSGGNVTLVAFASGTAGTGVITTAGLQGGILSAGVGGNNGNVEMIAGATSGVGINAGDINSAGTAVNLGGQVILLTATPSIQGMTILDGIVAANSVLSASTLQNASISVGSITTNEVPITIVSGNNVTLNGSISTSGTPAFTVNGPGGNLGILAAGNISTGANGTTISTAGAANANGGAVLFLAGASFQPTLTHTFNVAGDVINLSTNVAGPSGTGGFIDMTGGGAFNLKTLSTIGNNTGAGFSGGNVQLVAFGGTTANTGIVTMPSTSTIETYGLSNGNSISNVINTNGDVTIFAGNNSGAGTTSISTGIITTFLAGVGSNAGAGNITLATKQASALLPVIYQNGTITQGGFDAGGLASASISINGNISAEGGSVLLPAPALGVNTTQTTAITVQSGGNINISANVTNTNNTLPAGNLPGGCGPNCNGVSSSTITITANGTLAFTGGPVIASNAAATNPVNGQGTGGGTIVLQAQSFTGAGTINANATGGFVVANGSGGNGGVITITGTGTGAGSTIQLGPTGIAVSAQGDTPGGNGGTLTVNSASNIAVDVSGVNPIQINPQAGSNSLVDPLAGSLSFINSGLGGVLTLNSAGTLVVTGGGLDASGAASNFDLGTSTGNPGGNGGQIFITVNSSTPFDIGSVGVPTNGIQGVLSANGNTVNGANTEAFGNGGFISVTNSGGGIIIEANSLSVQAAAANTVYQGGVGGTILLSGTTVLANSALDASGGGSSATNVSGNGGNINISTSSTTSFEVGTPTSNGVVGSITANGNVVGSGTPPVGPAAVPAPNAGTGGTITLTNSLSGGILIDAAGSLSVAAANASQNFPAGNGGTITLSAPTGPVLSMSALSVNGGAASNGTAVDAGVGGIITITSFSSNPFVIGALGGATNGVSTSISADGYSAGTISVANNGTGGIQVGTNTLSLLANSNASVTNAAGNGGQLTLSAPLGPIAVTGNLDASGASGSNFGGLAGSITITSNSSTVLSVGSQPFGSTNFISGNLTANGGTGTAGNGDAGNISVCNLGGGINVSNNAILATAPAATLSGYAGAGGNLSLNAAGSVVIAGQLSASGGAASTTSANSAGFGGTITITENDTSTFDIGGASVGQLSANGWSGGTISVTNSGSGGITVQPNGISVTAGAAQYQFPANPLQYGQNGTPGPGGTVNLNAPAGQVVVNGTIDVSGGAIFQQVPTNVLNAGTTVLDVGSVQGFAVNQTVTITDGVNTETQVITLVGPTSITVGPLANTYGASATVSAYSLTQQATNTVVTNVLNNALNPLPLGPGTTVINLADTTGYLIGQTVQISNPEFVEGATNIPTVQANSTINVANTSGFGIGQSVTIAGNGLTETQIISGVTPGVSITVDVTNIYTLAPTVTANAVQETQLITNVTPGVSITVNPLTKTYAVTPPVLSVTSVLDVPSTQGFIQNQAVSITAGTTSEVQFIQSINPTSLVFTNLANNYTTPPVVTAFSQAGAVNIVSQQGVSQTAGSINAGTLNINSASGGVGSAATPLQVNVLASALPGTLTLSSAGLANIVNGSTNVALGNISTGSNFSLSSNGNIFSNGAINSQGLVTLLNTNAAFGNIAISNSTGGSAISSAGLLTIQNNNLAGTINIANSISGGGGLVLTNGPAPVAPVAGTTPANVTVNSAGGFGAFFGPNGLVAGAPGVTIGAANGNVIFNGANANSITLTGGVIINTTSTAPPTLPTVPPVLGASPAPPVILLGSIAGSSSPTFGTIISTDQTPESNPEQSGDLSKEQASSSTLSSLFNRATDATQKLLYFSPDFEQAAETSFINLQDGNGLVLASKLTHIHTSLADITLDAGSAVLIFQTSTGLAILNLHDDHQSAVHATVNGVDLEIPIGRQLVLTSKTDAQFDDINPSSIGYRGLTSFSVGGKKAFVSEFSTLSALTTVTKMLKQPNKAEQLLTQRMLKSAAAIYLLGQQQKKDMYRTSSSSIKP